MRSPITGSVRPGVRGVTAAHRSLRQSTGIVGEALQVTKIQKKNGTGGWTVLGEASAGDIVSVAGLTGAGIGDTITNTEAAPPLEPGQIDPPTLAMVFSPNSSPLGLAPGNVVTSQKIMERLEMEAANSVSLRVCPARTKAGLARIGQAVTEQAAGRWHRSGCGPASRPPHVTAG